MMKKALLVLGLTVASWFIALGFGVAVAVATAGLGAGAVGPYLALAIGLELLALVASVMVTWRVLRALAGEWLPWLMAQAFVQTAVFLVLGGTTVVLFNR